VAPEVERLHVAAHERGRELEVGGEFGGRGNRRFGKIDARYFRPQPRPGEGVQAEVALQV
jgi:hypothetical protein